MTESYLQTYSYKLWRAIGDVVSGAVVYVDNTTAECLHWQGGLEYFLKCGARAVKQFHESEHPSGYWDEVVFLVNGPILASNLDTIETILSRGQFIKCTLVTSDTNRGHDDKPYALVKEKILDCMGSKKFEAVVVCLPVFVACISPFLFVMPPFAHLFPPLETSVDSLEQKKNENHKTCFSSTPDEIMFKQAMSFCLDTFLSELNVKEDIFVWGQLSHAVGTEILKLSGFKRRRKNNSGQRASVILLDRTVDLSPCLTHQCDCILDSVVRTLPALPNHACCDVAVDMTPLLYPSIKNHNRENLGILPGCLAGHGKTSVLNTMVSFKTKECLMEINRQLVSVGNQHGIGLKAAGARITPESLLHKVQAFSDKPSSILECQELLQQALAVVECLKSPLHEKQSLLLSTERLLVQNMTASQEGPIRNILHILAHMKDRNMTLEDVMVLLAHLSAVSQGSLWKQEDEAKLQGALAEVIFQDLENLPQFFKNLVEDPSEESNVLSGISQTFKCLKTIGKGRQNYKKYRSVLSQENPAMPATYKPVFQQLLRDILHPSRPEIPDLQCVSTGITDMLKSGLGLFMNVQKPHPQDNPFLIIIVLGGITGSEVMAFKDMVSASKRQHQVIIGSTKISKPSDILNSVFKL